MIERCVHPCHQKPRERERHSVNDEPLFKPLLELRGRDNVNMNTNRSSNCSSWNGAMDKPANLVVCMRQSARLMFARQGSRISSIRCSCFSDNFFSSEYARRSFPARLIASRTSSTVTPFEL